MVTIELRKKNEKIISVGADEPEARVGIELSKNLRQGTVAEGFGAVVVIGEVTYVIRDFRERKCHTPGATVKAGDGVLIGLGPGRDNVEMNNVEFRWRGKS